MTDINISTPDIIVLAVYIVLIVSWGLINSSRKSAEGYFLGGRSMKWPVVGVSMFAMMVSSSAIIGWAGDAYSTGISVFNYGLSGGVFVLIFFLIFILPFYLKSKVYTMPEFLEKRYDSRSRYYLSFVTLIQYIFADASITLYAGALMLQNVFPELEIWKLVWIIALIAASYTILGGLSSVMMADLIQAGILIFGAAIVTYFAFDKAGGWSEVMSSIDKNMISLIRPADDPSVPWPALIITLPMLGFFFWCTSQAMVQRTLSSKDINHARWGNLFSTVLMFSSFFFMILPGIAGKIIYPNLEKADMIFPTLVFDLLPKGLIGLLLAALLAAMASTLSAILNSASTLFTMDFANKIFPNMSSKRQVLVGRLSGLVIICIASLWAPQVGKFDSIIKYFQEVLTYLSPPIVAVFLLGIFWKRTTASGAFTGLITGFLTALSLMLIKNIDPGTGNKLLGFLANTFAFLRDWNFLYIGPILLGFSVIIIITVSSITKQAEESKVINLIWTKKLVNEETIALKGIPWYKNFRVLSVIVILLTLLFMFIWR